VELSNFERNSADGSGEEPWPRFCEAVELLRQAWTGAEFDFRAVLPRKGPGDSGIGAAVDGCDVDAGVRKAANWLPLGERPCKPAVMRHWAQIHREAAAARVGAVGGAAARAGCVARRRRTRLVAISARIVVLLPEIPRFVAARNLGPPGSHARRISTSAAIA
jgi:hypothetical protein